MNSWKKLADSVTQYKPRPRKNKEAGSLFGQEKPDGVSEPGFEISKISP